MKHLSAIVFLLLITFSSMASDFSGAWSGEGFINTLDDHTSQEAWFRLNVEVTDEKISIEQCSMFKDGRSDEACFVSEYKVAEGSIYNDRDEKIGDIYPSNIIIYDANSQMSAQTLLDINNNAEMRYNYTYTNVDGASVYMRSYLLKNK